MINLFAILFTLGGILGFLTMGTHSYYFSDDRRDTGFIFGGGFILAYFLEYTLIHLLGAYDYTNLPLVLFEVPLVIPMGWVVTFYGLSFLVKDSLDELGIHSNWFVISILTGILALFFGMSIEVLARNIEFWEFHFEALKLGGVPVIVTLAWGLSVLAFTAGVEMYHKYPDLWWVIMAVVHLLNTAVAFVLIQFVTFS